MRRLVALLFMAIGLAASCEKRERAPYAGSAAAGGSGGLAIDAGLGGGPPAADAGGLCGNLILPIVTEEPNLYFILDRSGSMADPLPNSSETKFFAARYAIAQVLKAIGHRVHYGGAVFPMPSDSDDCLAGAEVFATRDGDPPSTARGPQYGPVLYSFLVELSHYTPEGGTPTAATLSALQPILTALPGKTVAVLATDGAPNCNADASCSAEDCQLTIEGATLGGQACTTAFNCCDPALVSDGQLNCVDDDATESAVGELALAGIDTYVIGMPGSEFYANVLDRLAIAGHTARPAAPLYYSTKSSAELTDALREIGIEVAISCTIALDQAPPDPKLVNVYFDTTLVGYDELDGWAWANPTTIELRGSACTKLKSGDVLQVQVVSGCPTVIR